MTLTSVYHECTESLGWLFCEIAFRGFEWLGNDAYRDDGWDYMPRWWAWLPDKLLGASYRAGCWFYSRATP